MPTRPSPRSERLGTPNNPAIRFTRGSSFEASLVRHCYGLSGCSPPWTDLTEFPRPPGAFTSRLPTARSPFPSLDMTTTATGLLCWRDFHPQEWQLASLHQIASDYAWLNPHVTMTMEWFGERTTIAATDPAWAKWKPSDPTSAHWYSPAHLERLIAGYVSHDATLGQDRTVRELVAEFRGLSGTAKQKKVLEATSLSRAPLSQLIKGQAIDRNAVEGLLAAMKAASKPVKPDMLGTIGKEHFQTRFAEAGCEMESFEYRRVIGIEDGVPWIIETAFGWCPDASARRLVTGV